MLIRLRDLINPNRLTEVVDIGANPIDGDAPYQAMLDARVCRVTGFEPQISALAELNGRKGLQESYLPYAIGDGRTHSLQFCQSAGFTSLLEPDPASLALFDYYAPLGRVISRQSVTTRTLDSISEIHTLDFLKIDIQGGELAVFQNGRQKLSNAVMIQSEISFITLYKDQPSFGDIDIEMRHQGFIPHSFANIKRWPITPCIVDGDPVRPLNQLLEADVVYMKDIRHMDRLDDEQLKHMILIAHGCYGSFDLAIRCLTSLIQRSSLPSDTLTEYFELVRGS